MEKEMSTTSNRTQALTQLALTIVLILLPTYPAAAFRVFDPSRFVQQGQFAGVTRWNADPHFVDGFERSLDGGLRYSFQGGNYASFRDLFNWGQRVPTVEDFQAAVENSFSAWESVDPVSGLETDIRFTPDLDTPIVINPLPGNVHDLIGLSRGSEIDIGVTSLEEIGSTALMFAGFDPDADTVTLTSGVEGYSAAVFAGVDILISSRPSFSPQWNLDTFQTVLTHELGHALGLADVDLPTGNFDVNSPYLDDNFDDSSNVTALETLTNSFALLIDPFDPDNSPGLLEFEICTSPEGCSSLPGLDSPGVDLLMESSPQARILDLKDDEYAGRQFLYPFLPVDLIRGDLDKNGELDVADIDKLQDLVRSGQFDSQADFTFDGVVDLADLELWVRDLKQTYFGDASLDGEFNSGDLVTVFAAGQYEDDIFQNSSWATGDWNGDAEFDTGDLVFAFQDGGFEEGPRLALNVVPEPSSASLIATIGLLSMWRRRTSNAY